MHIGTTTNVRILRFAGYAVAVVAAWCALGGTLAVSAAPPLFGWQRLLVVQLVMALPLCVLAATTLVRHVADQRLAVLAISIIVALLTLFGVAYLLPIAAPAFTDAEPSFWVAAALRSLVCTILLLPPCVAVEMACAGFTSRFGECPPRATGWWAALGLVAAIAIPAAYARQLCQRQTEIAIDLLQRQQLAAAQRIVHRLSTAGSDVPIGRAAPRLVAHQLSQAIATLEARLKATRPQPLDPAQAIERARLLAMLDQLPAAQQLLAPLAESQPDAALLLAAILQQQASWQPSSRWYQQARQLLRAMPESPQRAAGLVRALDGLAFNAREQGEYREAEGFYAAGLRELPEAAAHFHFQLGRHHQAGGRPLAAIVHLQQSAALDAQNYAAPAEMQIRQLAAGSPGCWLGASPTSPRPQTAP